MSDVEARHALLIFRQAYLSPHDASGPLILTLVTDLDRGQSTATDKRGTAIAALRALAVSFEHHIWPSAAAWELAHEALQAWCSEP
jgi:hypothetical protein